MTEFAPFTGMPEPATAFLLLLGRGYGELTD